MIPRILPSDLARVLAVRSGIVEDMFSEADLHAVQTGNPTSIYQRIDLVLKPGGPPNAVALLTLSVGFPDPDNNGWSGAICGPVANQQQLNLARRHIEGCLDFLFNIDCEWIHL